jgi:hypothetical protein
MKIAAGVGPRISNLSFLQGRDTSLDHAAAEGGVNSAA